MSSAQTNKCPAVELHKYTCQAEKKKRFAKGVSRLDGLVKTIICLLTTLLGPGDGHKEAKLVFSRSLMRGFSGVLR